MARRRQRPRPRWMPPAVWAVAGLLVITVGLAPALDIHNHYSPHNRERPLRPSTRYIILHTTEGPTSGSLKKVHERGETHYLIDPAGKAYRIIDRRRVALHAGRSMWEGRTNIDDVSIGIEVVGYHDKEITAAQYDTLRELLAELQGLYAIPDERVLTHSMVAYGSPNRWHKRSHRGRKRCGMQFARVDVRRRLGLTRKPLRDPDVDAGRLAVGDPYLAGLLYAPGRSSGPATKPDASDPRTIAPNRSAWDIAREHYNQPETRYIFSDGKELRGDEIEDWTRLRAGTRVMLAESPPENTRESVYEIGRHGKAAREIAGEEYNGPRTIYLLVDGRVRNGAELEPAELDALPDGTRVLVGYTQGGAITAKRSAFDVCGVKWNDPSTFYRMADGSLLPGDRVSEKSIPSGTLVFFRN